VLPERDLVAVERIVNFTSDPQYKLAFKSMLDEGISGKRKFCTPILLLSEDVKYIRFDADGLLKNYSVEKLWKESRKSSNWSEFESKHLKKFEDATVTLNSPTLAYLFEMAFFRFSEGDPYASPTPEGTFNSKSCNCIGNSVFLEYCSEKNGYNFDKFDKNPETVYPPDDKSEIHETNATCLIATNFFTGDGILAGIGHEVVAEKKDGKIYLRDATNWWHNPGPFNSIKDMVEANSTGEFYISRIQDYHPWRVRGFILSEPLKEKMMKDESFKRNMKGVLATSPTRSKENAEYNKWAIDYFDSL
jgi:hypothetical protein